MYKHKQVLFGLAALLLAGSLPGQTLPPANLVTIPTAGTMQRGSYEVEMLMQAGGGVLGRLGVGITDQFSLGMSYGVQKFIGDQRPSINRTMPEAQLKYRLFEESYKMPAIAIGLDTQGRGDFQSEEVHEIITDTTTGLSRDKVTTYERYEIKAIGLYVVASKNWDVWGNFGSHIGISKNLLESDDIDDDLNLFFGVDKDLNEEFSVFMEFNSALDDNGYKGDDLAKLEGFTVGKGNGYLNAGFRWHIAPTFYMEIDFNDILINKKKVDVENISRELKVVFNDYF